MTHLLVYLCVLVLPDDRLSPSGVAVKRELWMAAAFGMGWFLGWTMAYLRWGSL